MINTVLFDLDGTLLKMSQDDFIGTYFKELKKVFARLDMDPELSIKAVWAGTKAMMENDGSMLNIHRFWEAFSNFLSLDNEKVKRVESQCDLFYTNEFNCVKSVLEPTDIPKRLIRELSARGFTVALATNPLFPECAVTTRLGWLEMTPHDFALITHYANSRYCKPNLGYFREVLDKLGKKSEECIMVGNSVAEDMAAASLGIETFLVTDYMENESNTDISIYRHGTQEEAEAFLLSL